MSLSFVSKAIQTTAEDGTFEEKPVENSEGGMVGTSVTGSGEGLFEQLRKNQEEADAEREEFQRSIMRGTLALDEEDAAHLEQLNKMRQEELALRQQQTAVELASFRAARADRQHSRIEQPDEAAASFFGVKFESEESAAPVEKKHGPIFIKKKRKRVEDRSEEILQNEHATIDNSITLRTGAGATQDDTYEPKRKTEEGGGGISNLLAGYSSSSDEEADVDE